MALHQKPEKILENLRLLMPVSMSFSDPLGGPAITVEHANLHALLVIDADRLAVEGQQIANIYAEMARYQRAAEYAADIAEVRYVKWKSAEELRFRASRTQVADEPEDAAPPADAPADGKKKKAPKAAPRPTVAEAEAAYRDHPDYERMSVEPKRLRAIAGIFEDLKWAAKMKSEHIREAAKLLGGYMATDRAADPPEPKPEENAMSALEEMRREAEEIVARSGSAAQLQKLLSSTPATEGAPGAPRGE